MEENNREKKNREKESLERMRIVYFHLKMSNIFIDTKGNERVKKINANKDKQKKINEDMNIHQKIIHNKKYIF